MKLSKTTLAPLCALLLLVLCLVAPASAQRFKWWQDDRYRNELGLTGEQSARLEEIFQKSAPALRKQKEALDRTQKTFDQLVERGNDAAIIEQVASVEVARAELNKLRIMMLLKMRRSLTADQWAKFTALHMHARDAAASRPAPK
jgi:Spy/CpxP family protein refolding chaperone